ESGRAAANELGMKLSKSVEETDKARQSEVTESRDLNSRARGELKQQVERYQMRLEQQQAGQTPNGPPATPPMAGTPLQSANQTAAGGTQAFTARPVEPLNRPASADDYALTVEG